MQSLCNIKIDKFPNLIRTFFVPSESQQMFIQSTNKMTYGHYVRFGAFWDAFLKWLENNQEDNNKRTVPFVLGESGPRSPPRLPPLQPTAPLAGPCRE